MEHSLYDSKWLMPLCYRIRSTTLMRKRFQEVSYIRILTLLLDCTARKNNYAVPPFPWNGSCKLERKTERPKVSILQFIHLLRRRGIFDQITIMIKFLLVLFLQVTSKKVIVKPNYKLFNRTSLQILVKI